LDCRAEIPGPAWAAALSLMNGGDHRTQCDRHQRRSVEWQGDRSSINGGSDGLANFSSDQGQRDLDDRLLAVTSKRYEGMADPSESTRGDLLPSACHPSQRARD